MIKQIFAKIVTLFMLVFCAGPVHGLTLKVARPGADTPLEIALHVTKRTEHVLAVKMADGTIYYADMRPVDESFPSGMFARIDGQIYQIGVAPATFSVTTTSGTDSFSFSMSAAGTFTVDWGDGDVQEIVRTDTEATTYSHTYAAAGKYIIGFEGKATRYSTDLVAPISFALNKNVGGIRGSLGAIFSTIGDGSGNGQQPRFYRIFLQCSNLVGPIPEKLFTGLRGPIVDHMFADIFSGCSNLTGAIPKNLFADVTGAPVKYGFSFAFFGCAKLSGPIPENLFAGVSGSINKTNMFLRTFYGCANLTSIPDNLFGNISGAPTWSEFWETFAYCTGLGGDSAKINGKYLYEIWPEYSTQCYLGATGLSDYADIPDAWK